jgi:CheY-like chemotaxis protein
MERTILIVDDNVLLRQLLSEILKTANFYVIEAENGCVALKLSEDLQPDLIVCDINIPNINGFEFLNALRRNYYTASIPVVILSDNSNDQYQKLSLKLGANAYLVKPVTSEKLLTVIAEQFSLKSTEST